MDHDELMELLEQGGTRQSVIRVLGGGIQTGGVVYQKETIEVEDEQGIRTVEWFETRRCSCGHVIDQKTPLAGVCTVCGRAVCSAEGCAHRCQRCGVLLCRSHAHLCKNQVYCGRHCYIPFLKAIFL